MLKYIFIIAVALLSQHVWASIPKNTLVVYGVDNTAALHYDMANWREEIVRVGISSCQEMDEKTCGPQRFERSTADYSVNLTGIGLWRIRLVSQDKPWRGPFESKAEWTQFVAVMAKPNSDVESAAAKYAPKLSFHESERFFPISIEMIFNRTAKDIGTTNNLRMVCTTPAAARVEG